MAVARGAELGRDLRSQQAIMGIFDEGCMGMYNAIIPDDLLHAAGVFKERLSQSALYAAMRAVGDYTARRHLDWLLARGMTFDLGADPGHAADRGPGARGAEDVRRRGAHRRTHSAAPSSASNTSRG